MNKYFLVLFLLISSVLSGQDKNYYVSQTDGNDSYTSEQAQNPATPWKTLGKADDLTYQPDDSIFFNKGDTWTAETFTPKGSGTSGHNIVITSYGTGDKPIITVRGELWDWDVEGSWTRPDPGENIWYIAIPDMVNKSRIWINGDEMRKAQYVAWIDETDRFRDSLGTNDRIYLYSIGNPALTYAGGLIEHGQLRSSAIYINSVDYYKIENLDLRGGYYTLRLRAADYITVDNCDIGNSATQFGLLGETVSGSGNTNITISNCTFDANSELTSDWEVKYTEDGLNHNSGGDDWEIYNCTFKNWGHNGLYVTNSTTTTCNDILIHDNFFTSPDISYGRAINVDCYGYTSTGMKIYRNLIRNIPTCNQLNAYGIEFYYNIIDTVRGMTFRPGYADGIQITYGTGVLSQDMKFYNNVFANCVEQGIYMSWYTGRPTKKNIEITNNIFYNNGDAGIYIMASDSIYNNTVKNNIIYKNGAVTPVYYRGTTISAETFNTSDSHGDTISDNLGDNPMFDTGFQLNPFSPAINKGIDVGLTTDYKKNPIEGFPEIGAYEYHPPSGILIDADGNFMIGSDGNIMTTE